MNIWLPQVPQQGGRLVLPPPTPAAVDDDEVCDCEPAEEGGGGARIAACLALLAFSCMIGRGLIEWIGIDQPVAMGLIGWLKAERSQTPDVGPKAVTSSRSMMPRARRRVLGGWAISISIDRCPRCIRPSAVEIDQYYPALGRARMP